MTQDRLTQDRRKPADRAAEQDRRSREAAALRANLLRRKAQQRARADQPGEAELAPAPAAGEAVGTEGNPDGGVGSGGGRPD